MGKYINEDSQGYKLGVKAKANALVLDGAEIIEAPSKFEPNLVCVVDNELFEAAAYAYCQAEMELFLKPDGRSKTWLRYPHAEKTAK